MKKYFLALCFPLFFIACSKSDECGYKDSTTVAPASEVAALQGYLTGNGITATANASGFFYVVTAAGAGTAPNICSKVTVKYTGKLTNGTVFDSNNTGVSFALGQLIIGWQKGLPLIQKGGSIRLYLPPSLGYGASASGPIPANSNLIFDISLVEVN